MEKIRELENKINDIRFETILAGSTTVGAGQSVSGYIKPDIPNEYKIAAAFSNGCDGNSKCNVTFINVGDDGVIGFYVLNNDESEHEVNPKIIVVLQKI